MRWSSVSKPTVIEGAGHLLEWDEPAAMGDALLEFLDQERRR